MPAAPSALSGLQGLILYSGVMIRALLSRGHYEGLSHVRPLSGSYQMPVSSGPAAPLVPRSLTWEERRWRRRRRWTIGGLEPYRIKVMLVENTRVAGKVRQEIITVLSVSTPASWKAFGSARLIRHCGINTGKRSHLPSEPPSGKA